MNDITFPSSSLSPVTHQKACPSRHLSYPRVDFEPPRQPCDPETVLNILPLHRSFSFTRNRTRPRLVRRSKITTKMARSLTSDKCMLSRCPSWNTFGKSASPISSARPLVAAIFPAVNEANEVRSSPSTEPELAMYWPLLSINTNDLRI